MGLCRWVQELGYSKLVTFESFDSQKLPIYHTNVMMAIGTSVAVVCGESITDSAQRQHLFVRFNALSLALPCMQEMVVFINGVRPL